MAELAVAVIHGMGTQDDKFAQPIIDELNDRVDDEGKDPTDIAWQSIFWADLLDGREIAYFNRAKTEADLDYLKLRRFVVTALGDSIAYQKVESDDSTAYQDICQRVSTAIHELYVDGLGSRPKPLLVLAHSLGGQIISNYIWDTHRDNDPNLPPFERMNWLSGIVTFGSNLPLFSFAYTKVVPIKFPPAMLRPDLKEKARWLNFYDPDDILGYPLKPISPEYRRVVDRDIPINVGKFYASWNPASHLGYWTDNDFTKPVARFIASFL